MSSSGKLDSVKPLPFQWNLLAGAIAGVSEILCFYPLDVVKTRFQLSVGSQQGTLVSAFKDIVKKEGVSALYRGILPPIMVEAPKRAIKFGANEYYKGLYLGLGIKDGTPLSVMTGVSAGCTEATVVVSFDLVKIRLQDKSNAGKYKGTADCVAKIFAEEGILGFFKGFEATVWRHAVWNGGYFGCIKTVRAILPEPETKEGMLFKNFIAGGIGGTVGTILNTPFDVVKTRVQNQIQPPFKYGWTIPAVVTIAKEEGVGALYKGFLPKVLRLGPGGGVLLVVFVRYFLYFKFDIYFTRISFRAI
ncbi:hypothetical protein HDU92_008374 [Lobulomyces angularis]|nr:hypothetical protein HDU92_008374 [Lobulomyces angularis]